MRSLMLHLCMALSDYMSVDQANLSLQGSSKSRSPVVATTALWALWQMSVSLRMSEARNAVLSLCRRRPGSAFGSCDTDRRVRTADAIFTSPKPSSACSKSTGTLKPQQSKAEICRGAAGARRFREAYREELTQVQQAKLTFPEIEFVDRSARESVIALRLFLGDIPAQQLRELSDIVLSNDGSAIRTTQTQNLQLRVFPRARWQAHARRCTR